MGISLVLFRPAVNSNIYIVDEKDGTVYGVTRGKATAGLLWSLAHHCLRSGDLKPMKYTKQILDVQRKYRACSAKPEGYVRTVLGWENATGEQSSLALAAFGGKAEIQLGYN